MSAAAHLHGYRPQATVILGERNYSEWNEWLHINIGYYPKAAAPILANEARIRPARPAIDRRDGEAPYYRLVEGVLTEESTRDLRADQRDYDRKTDELEDQDSQCQTFMFSSLSQSSISTIQSRNSDYLAATRKPNPFLLYTLISSTHNAAGGPQILSRFVNFVTIKQDGTHEDYLQRFAIGQANVERDLGCTGEHKGYIELDTLFATILIAGVDQAFFRTKIDSILDAAGGKVSNCPKLKTDLQQFWLDRKTTDPEPHSAFGAAVVTSGRTPATRAPAGKTPANRAPPATTEQEAHCVQCGNLFTPLVSMATGLPFSKCRHCHRAQRTRTAPTDLTSAKVAHGFSAAIAEAQREEIGHLRLQVDQLNAALAADFGHNDDDHAFRAAEDLDGSEYDWAGRPRYYSPA